MKSVLVKSGVDEKNILVEKNACELGTYDNAFMSRAVTDSCGLTIKKAIICCKSYHARRCLMTYSWAYPDTKFLVCPSNVGHHDYPNRNITKNNWFIDKIGIDEVMSELHKCGQYFKDAIPLFVDR